MKTKNLVFVLIIVAMVFVLLTLLVKISIQRSNDTIERIDQHIEAVMDR